MWQRSGSRPKAKGSRSRLGAYAAAGPRRFGYWSGHDSWRRKHKGRGRFAVPAIAESPHTNCQGATVPKAANQLKHAPCGVPFRPSLCQTPSVIMAARSLSHQPNNKRRPQLALFLSKTILAQTLAENWRAIVLRCKNPILPACQPTMTILARWLSATISGSRLAPADRLLLQQFMKYCDRSSLPLLCLDRNSDLRFPDGAVEFVLGPSACVELMRALRQGNAIDWAALPRRPAGSDHSGTDAAP